MEYYGEIFSTCLKQYRQLAEIFGQCYTKYWLVYDKYNANQHKGFIIFDLGHKHCLSHASPESGTTTHPFDIEQDPFCISTKCYLTLITIMT